MEVQLWKCSKCSLHFQSVTSYKRLILPVTLKWFSWINSWIWTSIWPQIVCIHWPAPYRWILENWNLKDVFVCLQCLLLGQASHDPINTRYVREQWLEWLKIRLLAHVQYWWFRITQLLDMTTTSFFFSHEWKTIAKAYFRKAKQKVRFWEDKRRVEKRTT